MFPEIFLSVQSFSFIRNFELYEKLSIKNADNYCAENYLIPATAFYDGLQTLGLTNARFSNIISLKTIWGNKRWR